MAGADACPPKQPVRPEPAFAGDNHVSIAFRAAHRDRMDQAALCDRGRQLFELCRIERPTRLVGVGDDPGEIKLDDTRKIG